MAKVAVVTAVFLIEFYTLDTPSLEFAKCDEYDYYMYTNDATKLQRYSVQHGGNWNVVELDCSNCTKGVYMTKRVKWLTHEFLPDYDVIIWVDSFIVPNPAEMDTLHGLVEKCANAITCVDAPIMYTPTQTIFKCIHDDIRWCQRKNRISDAMAHKIIDYIENTEQFSVHKPIQTHWTCAVVKPNKHPGLKAMSAELVHYIDTVCYRDQHILPVLLKKHNIRCSVLPAKTNIFIIQGQQNDGNHQYVKPPVITQQKPLLHTQVIKGILDFTQLPVTFTQLPVKTAPHNTAIPFYSKHGSNPTSSKRHAMTFDIK